MERRRVQAIEEILSYGGIDAVLEFANSVESPLYVGNTLGARDDDGADAAFLPERLLDTNKKFERLISGYVWSRHIRRGWEWVDGLDKSGWTTPEIVALLTRLSFVPATWERASTLLGDSESKYWESVNINPYEGEGNLDVAIDKLIEVGRPYSAIDCFSRLLHDKKEVDNKRAVAALLSAVSTEESQVIDSYHIEQLVKYLQDDPSTDQEDLFRVEWAYLPLLDRHEDASPKLLSGRLATDPDFFCEVIRLIYRSRNEEAENKEPTEDEQAIAINAWRLLHEWKMPPGTQPDGSFSGDALREWVANVRKISTDTGHLEVSLIYVGHVLFYSPPDPNGLWIDQAVADVINESEADDVRRGYSTEAYNSRGVHWVAPTAAPEHKLAEDYRQKADKVENAGYHRFAATLRGIADSYNREAERTIADHDNDETDT